MTLREFVATCRKHFGNGRAEFASTSRSTFTMRCIFKNRSNGQVFSNVSEFSYTVLGHHDALRLNRFFGPDGVPFKPAELKEYFDRLTDSRSNPNEDAQAAMLDATIQVEFRKDEVRGIGFTPKDIAVGCVRWQNGSVTYERKEGESIKSLQLNCTVRRSERVYFNQQSFLFAVPTAAPAQPIVFLMGISNKNTDTGETRQLNTEETLGLMRSIQNRLGRDK